MSKENLTHKEAIEKLKELSEKARICMFCTDLDKLPITSRPMALTEVDEEGNMWFISKEHSNKNQEIRENSDVQLFFMNNSNSEYLSVFGKAKIYQDRSTIEDKWTLMANAWFDGKEDSEVSIIRVTPESSYYWDTKNGKILTMLSFAKSIITGDTADNSNGVEGNLDI